MSNEPNRRASRDEPAVEDAAEAAARYEAPAIVVLGSVDALTAQQGSGEENIG